MVRQLNEQKYCGWCGLEVRYASDWASKCLSCGYTRYINPNPCSNIVVIRDDSILMVRRAIEPQLGKYDLPGGFMDMTDESMEACVYRELHEEVGLSEKDVTPLRYLGSAKAPDYIWQDSAIANTSFYYSATLKDPAADITLDKSENSEIIWVHREDLSDIDFAWEIDKYMLNTYFAAKHD